MPSASSATTFRQLLVLWTKPQELADDLGVSYYTVASWKRRNRIPAEWWDALIESAKLRNIRHVTFPHLVRIDALRRAQASRAKTTRNAFGRVVQPRTSSADSQVPPRKRGLSCQPAARL